MKAFSLILLIGLFIIQPFCLSLNASVGGDDTSYFSAEKKEVKKPVNIHLLKGTLIPNSLFPTVPGYIQDNQLYICFDASMSNEYLVVRDTDSDEIVYSGTFTGNTLVITLTNLGESYTIEIV